MLDPPVRLEAGQEVVIAYTVATSAKSVEKKSNIVDSLIGAIPNTGKTLDDYRSERRLLRTSTTLHAIRPISKIRVYRY